MTRGSLPMVSVVLPTHNRPALLAEALQSIAAQTIGDWEVIVVDDASDPPAQLLATEDKRLHVVRLKASRGGAGAKNTGASLARGDVLAFLDDDDLYAPTYLARALAVLDRHPEVQVVFMGVSWFWPRGAWGPGLPRIHGKGACSPWGSREDLVAPPLLSRFFTLLESADDAIHLT